jgi:hypothetical protein
LQNGATLAAGTVGQAFRFTGGTQYVSIPHAAILNPPTALTIDAWIKADFTHSGIGLDIADIIFDTMNWHSFKTRHSTDNHLERSNSPSGLAQRLSYSPALLPFRMTANSTTLPQLTMVLP